jgi:predicted dienelactone hydrolase
MRLRFFLAGFCTVLLGALLAPPSFAETPGIPYKVGIRQVEFKDTKYGDRTLALAVFYPADLAGAAPVPFTMPFFVGLDLLKDAPIAASDKPYPLVMLSHGRGSNPLIYAWFAQLLASHGYIVAGPYHHQANTYDATIAYLANKLWQRPVDISLLITHLTDDPEWGKAIDPERIGVAGHSQGGFTSLWIGGAKVNRDKYLAFQQGWHNNKMVPQHLRDALALDPGPALDVADKRIKAVFSMAPGIIKAFGMDEAGLAALKLPTSIIVGARDTQTPPADNAEFAAAHIPGAQLTIIPGKVDHEIFTNECDQEGKDEFPEACIDAEGVDRAAIHREIGAAALKFFGKHLKGTP